MDSLETTKTVRKIKNVLSFQLNIDRKRKYVVVDSLNYEEAKYLIEQKYPTAHIRNFREVEVLS